MMDAKVGFWNAMILRQSGKQVSSHFLQRLIKKAGVSERLSVFSGLTKDELHERRSKAYKDYRHFVEQKSVIARANWLEDLAEARAAATLKQQESDSKRIRSSRYSKQLKPGQTPLSKASDTELRQLRDRERLRTTAKRVKAALGSGRASGVTMISVPDEDNVNGPWIERTSQADIEAGCCWENQRRFSQTNRTPPMIQPLRSQLGFLGISSDSKNVLDGSFHHRAGTDPHALRLLQKLQRLPGTQSNPIQAGISTESFMRGWKRAKERTSAGASLLNFSHCKAMATRKSIADFEAAMVSIPQRSGYAYKRWRRGIDVMIPKKTDSIRADKLRTIVLFEADFNFINKDIGRKTAIRAELNHNGFAQEQGGSRKNFRAVELALNKVLTYDHLRQMKWPGVLCSNDLKSNYDRIVHSVASLCMQRQGLQESEVICMFSALQDLEHHVRTAYGDSSGTYGGEVWVVPMQGVYQGNGAGPVIWAVVSSPLLQIMKEEGFGTFFRTSISDHKIQLVGYAFVDDTDLVQTGKTGQEPAQDILTQMQAGIDLWGGLIKATGGAFSLKKSRWWLLDFKWHPDGTWSYFTNAELPGVLTAEDYDEINKDVTRLEPSEAFETLGVWIAPNGNQDRAFEELCKVAIKWADQIRVSYLQKHDAAYALKTTILKKLEYAMPALSLTESQCNAIMLPVLKAALPKAGYNRNFPRALIYGPIAQLGMGIHSLYTTQVVEQVALALRHGPRDSFTGQLLRGTIETTKLELGMPGKLFEQNFKLLGRLATDCWIKHLWSNLKGFSIKLDEQTPDLQLQRINDRFLISAFVQAGYKNKQLERLNRCRKRLHATTLADIVTGDGRKIIPSVFEGDNPLKGQSLYQWPNQGPIPPTDWVLWRRALKRALQLRPDGSLPITLGRWIDSGARDWQAWFDPQDSAIYQKHAQGWQRYLQNPGSVNTRPSYQLDGQVENLPLDCRRAVVWHHDDELFSSGSARTRLDVIDEPTSFAEAIESLPPEQAWAVAHLVDSGHLEAIAQGLVNGTVIAVADGSFKTQLGTAGFTIVDEASGHRLEGANLVPGLPSDQSAYRSELAGLFGITIVCTILCRIYRVTNGSIEIACDGLAAGQHALVYSDPINPTQDHFDMISAIRNLKNGLPIQATYRHVEGHQKEKYPSRQLDKWAILNDKMDILAKTFWTIQNRITRPAAQQTVAPGEWSLWIANQKICKDLKATVRNSIQCQRLHSWWIEKKHFTAQQIKSMDSTASQMAMTRARIARRRWVCKFAANYGPVGRNMKRWKFWPDDRCPRCLCPNETTCHVLQCPDPRSNQQKQESLVTFEKQLRFLRTAPSIRQALMLIVRSWLYSEPMPDLHLAPLEVRRAVAHQTVLGWEQFMKGRIVTHWATLQDYEFCRRRQRHSGATWAASLVLAIWDLSWSLWDHRNEVLHTPEIQDRFINMDSIDLEIIEEWHAGYDDLWAIDKMQFRGISLDELLGRTSRFRRVWLLYVQQARSAPTLAD